MPAGVATVGQDERVFKADPTPPQGKVEPPAGAPTAEFSAWGPPNIR